LKNDKLIDILNYIKRINSLPNAYITYRIMLIILISTTERIFSKLKLIKFYIRSTMSQKKNKRISFIVY